MNEWLTGSVPPDKCGNSGNHELDIDSRRRNNDPLPFTGQGPSVGHIAIKRRGKAEQQKAHFMDFTAIKSTTEAVAKLVNDLNNPQGEPKVSRRFETEELIIVWQLRHKDVKVG